MSSDDIDVESLRPTQPALVPLPDITRYLLPKEQLLYVDRRHPVVLLAPVLIALGVSVMAGLLVTATGAGAMLDLYVWIVIGAIGWVLLRVLRWSRTVLVVTDRRVFECQSMFIARAAIRPVFRQSVVFRQDPVGQRLNYGTVLTETPNGDRVNTFKWIHNPRAFYQAVTDKAV